MNFTAYCLVINYYTYCDKLHILETQLLHYATTIIIALYALLVILGKALLWWSHTRERGGQREKISMTKLSWG